MAQAVSSNLSLATIRVHHRSDWADFTRSDYLGVEALRARSQVPAAYLS